MLCSLVQYFWEDVTFIFRELHHPVERLCHKGDDKTDINISYVISIMAPVAKGWGQSEQIIHSAYLTLRLSLVFPFKLWEFLSPDPQNVSVHIMLVPYNLSYHWLRKSLHMHLVYSRNVHNAWRTVSTSSSETGSCPEFLPLHRHWDCEWLEQCLNGRSQALFIPAFV
jgi:hypothetical protein